MELVTQVGRIVVVAVLVFVLGFAYATVSPLPTSASGQCPSDYCHDRPGSRLGGPSCQGNVCDSRNKICCMEPIIIEVEQES